MTGTVTNFERGNIVRSADRSPIEQLMYPLGYAYGYSMESAPTCAISARAGRMSDEGVLKMTVASKLQATVCGQCGTEGETIQPLFDLDMASTLIPMRYTSLKTYLSKHKDQFPPRYMLTYGHRRIRMLSAREIKIIRMGLLRGPGRHTW